MSLSEFSRYLMIPYSKVYNALTAIGLPKDKPLDNQTGTKIIIQIQQSSISFTALSNYFGSNTTLKELSDIEEKHILEKFRKLREKHKSKNYPKTKDIFGLLDDDN